MSALSAVSLAKSAAVASESISRRLANACSGSSAIPLDQLVERVRVDPAFAAASAIAGTWVANSELGACPSRRPTR